MRFAVVAAHQTQWPVVVLCRTLEVSIAGFWARKRRPPCARARRDAGLAKAIAESHAASHGVYGVPRVHKDLHETDTTVSRRTVARLMRELGIVGASDRARRVRTTIVNASHPKADNVLNRDFTAEQPNQRWVTDITEIATDEGSVYLAAILDLFSRKVVA